MRTTAILITRKNNQNEILKLLSVTILIRMFMKKECWVEDSTDAMFRIVDAISRVGVCPH